MGTTPSQFFSNNLKWITLILTVLFLFKGIQSCNRSVKLNMTTKEYINQIDSLDKLYSNYYTKSQDSIKKLNFELRLAKEFAKSANERATAVQSAVEKIKSNTTTTIVVKGAEEFKDTAKRLK